MRPIALSGLGFVALLSLACGQEPPPDQASAEADPAALFSSIEERLVSASTLELAFSVTSEGAVESEFAGTLRFAPDGSTALHASGTFAGETADLALRSDGQSYEFGNGPERTTAPSPPHLREALAIGLTRMGILHNLAMLVGNSPPDGGEGGVREWAAVDSLAFDAAQAGDAESTWVSFLLTVAGAPAGSASVQIGPGGRLAGRRQTVQFPEGTMYVVETYTEVVIDP